MPPVSQQVSKCRERDRRGASGKSRESLAKETHNVEREIDR